jgi:hypothetical protein
MLPNEVMTIVFGHLPTGDVVRARRVCRLWRALADDFECGRRMTVAIADDRIPVVASTLGAIVYYGTCTLPTVAAVLRRYDQLHSIVLAEVVDPEPGAHGDDDYDWSMDVCGSDLDSLATLRHVYFHVNSLVASERLLPLTNAATSLVVVGHVQTLLRLPNRTGIRALRGDVYGDDGGGGESLSALLSSMPNLRYVQICWARPWSWYHVFVPNTVDHADVASMYSRPLPPSVQSAHSDTVDPSTYPSLRVLRTTRRVDAGFAGLHALVKGNFGAMGSLSVLTSLRFLVLLGGTRTKLRQVAEAYAALARLPHLVGLAICYSPDEQLARKVDASVTLPRLRRLAVSDRVLACGLPSLPALEAAFVICGEDDWRTVFSGGDGTRTPWTADEWDALLRMRALSTEGDLMLTHEHDPRCAARYPKTGTPPDAMPRRLANMPLLRFEDNDSIECSCQLLSYAS